MAVIGTADRNAVVPRRRLNPYILEPGLSRDPAIGDAIECHTTRHAQVPGAGRFAQPDRTFEENVLRIILDPPGKVLPVPDGWTCFPVRFAVHQPRLVELHPPVGN